MIKKQPTPQQKYWVMIGDKYSPGFQCGEVEYVEYDEDGKLPSGLKLKTGIEWSPYDGYHPLDNASMQSFEDEYNDDGFNYREFFGEDEINVQVRTMIYTLFREYE